jgi:hypothetical protein
MCAVMLDEGAPEDDTTAHSRMKCWGWGAFGGLGKFVFVCCKDFLSSSSSSSSSLVGYGSRDSIGQKTDFLPKDAGLVPVQSIKQDPWIVAGINRWQARRSMSRNRHYHICNNRCRH